MRRSMWMEKGRALGGGTNGGRREAWRIEGRRRNLRQLDGGVAATASPKTWSASSWAKNGRA